MTELLTQGAVWGVLLTGGAFALGTVLQKKTGQVWCNPLLLATLFILLFLRLCEIPYPEYKASHLDPNFTRADEVKAGREKRVFTECAEVIAAGKLGTALTPSPTPTRK